MAQDDEINEARRKAMRNGEEDPVVVAQRYLNIYRQMHIFPPERKEAFDKMLIEIPANIRSILGSLPGGLMLQDYIGDLIEKQGGKPISSDTQAPSSKPILETVLEQKNTATDSTPVQPVITQPTPIIQGGNVEISLGKDFAEQFAGAFDALLKKQSDLHNESIEKIGADLSRGQQELAQYIAKNQENEQKIFALITKALEQHQIPNQSAISGGELNTDQSLAVQQLIDGQKEINLRLNKMESTSLNHSNENNQELINALIKSNTEAMQKFAAMQQSSTSLNQATNSVSLPDNTEHIINLIEQSQARLIEGVVERVMQNNLAQGQSQTANNANNIQINTPDTSAQTLMLVNKIADLQTANEKNMESAIERLIKAQKEIYATIDNNRSQEIAEAIVKGLQSSSLVINNYVPAESTKYSSDFAKDDLEQPVTAENIVDEIKADDDNMEPDYTEPDYIEPKPIETVKKKKKKKKKKKEFNLPNTDVKFENNTQYSETNSELSYQNNDNNYFDSNKTIIDEVQKNAVENKIYEKDNDVKNIKSNSANKPISDLTEKSFIIPSFDSDNDISTNEVEITSSSSDWGFSETENDAITDDNTAIMNNDENTNYDNVETIGSDSYIYIDDLSNQTDMQNTSPVVYNTDHPQIKVMPQIYDDEDDDEKDPYVK